MLKRLALWTSLFALAPAGALAQVVNQPGPPTPAACAYNSAVPTPTDGQAFWVQCDSAGNLRVSGTLSFSGTGANNADNVAAVGTGLTSTVAYNYIFDGATWDRWTGAVSPGTAANWGIGATGSAVPANADYIGVSSGGTLVGLTLGQAAMAASLPVAIASNQTSLPVSATLSAETTKVIGTVNQGTSPWVTSATQSGTWTVQPGNTANTTPWLVNVSQINGVTPLMGNGVTGTGSPRVTIASDNTAFTVNAAQSGTWNINNISGTVSLPTGAATAANQTSIIGTKAAGTAATNSLLNGVVFNAAAPAPTNGQQVALQADAAGSAYTNTEGRKASFRAAGNNNLTAAATDACLVTGSSTKTVRVTSVRVTGVASTAVRTPIFLIKRSTANSGGTIASLNLVPLDSNNAGSTAAAQTYSANPTTGTTVGNVGFSYTFFSTATADANPLFFEFGTRNAQSIVLRGTAEGLAVNLGGVTVIGGVIACEFEWTEE